MASPADRGIVEGFTPDGRGVVVSPRYDFGFGKRRVRILACDVCVGPAALVRLAGARVPRLLTRAERRVYLHEQPPRKSAAIGHLPVVRCIAARVCPA